MPREIRDDEFVSQYGSLRKDPVFRARPRPGSPMRRAMSVTIGRRSAAEMALFVDRTPDPATDGVRYATAGELRKAGFQVVHTPSRANRDHASVEWDNEWDDTVAEKFNECFEADHE